LPQADPNRFPIAAQDLEHVDLADIVKQARPIALHLDGRLKLIGAHAQTFNGGFVDTTAASAAEVSFERDEKDPSLPPGRDKTDVKLVWVTADRGSFLVSGRHESSWGSWAGPGVDDPRCSSQAAWRVMLRSHVPANTVAELRLDSDGHMAFWRLDVEGHSELRREVDAKTCRLVWAG